MRILPTWTRHAAAALTAVALMATTVLSAWILITSGLLFGAQQALGSPTGPSPIAQTESIETESSVKVTGAFQLSQPRDPFRPLITEDSPVGGIPGVGGPPGSDSGSGDGGFTPVGTSITLVSIQDVGGTLRATIVVNGVEYDVGVGDTFAGSFKVVSLTEDTAVIMYGDNAFELKVGQQIMK